MAITLQLATDDTPEPWQAADAFETAQLDYAREGLPTARPRSLWRTLWALLKRLVRGVGWIFGAVLVAVAFSLLVAATIIRLVFAAGAGVLLMLRQLSPFKAYAWLRYRGDVPFAQVA